MRILTTLAALAVVTFAIHEAAGQTLLDRIEGKLRPGASKAPADPAVPADAAPVASKGYLGFTPDETTVDGKGVWVESIKPGAPAELGGLKKGDLITHVDGKAIKGLLDLDPLLDQSTVGQKMRMTVDRAGKLVSLNLTFGARPPKPGATASVTDADTKPAPSPATTDPLSPPATTPPATSPRADAPALEPPANTDPADSPAPIRSKPLTLTPPAGDDPAAEPSPADPASDRPSPAPRSIFDPADPSAPALSDPAATPAESDPAEPAAASGKPSLGITVLPLTDDARSLYGLEVRRGALITGVRPGSPADVAGLPIGGCVVAIDGRRIDSADDLVAAIRATRAGQEVELTYYEGPTLARKSVRLAPAGSGIIAAAPPPSATEESPFGLPRTDRPLLGKIEGVVDNITRRGPSTVYDPSEMAALRDNVLRLEKLVDDLENRVKTLEGKGGDATPVDALGGAAPSP